MSTRLSYSFARVLLLWHTWPPGNCLDKGLDRLPGGGWNGEGGDAVHGKTDSACSAGNADAAADAAGATRAGEDAAEDVAKDAAKDVAIDGAKDDAKDGAKGDAKDETKEDADAAQVARCALPVMEDSENILDTFAESFRHRLPVLFTPGSV